MCNFCKTYGTKKIDDEYKLKEALYAVGGNMSEHTLKLIDAWIDGDQEPDHEVEELWEKTRHRR